MKERKKGASLQLVFIFTLQGLAATTLAVSCVGHCILSNLTFHSH
jgi:hypothetical protein